MDKFKTIKGIKKFKKIAIRVLLALVLLLLLLGITLSLPFVQTKIGAYVTEMLHKEFKCDIKVEKVAITIFGTAKLKTVMIRDHHKDTLFYANRIQTNILSFEKLYHGDLLFGDVRIDGLFFNMKQYKGEKTTNLDHFVELFETGKPSSGKKFLLKANNVYLTNNHFLYTDENFIPKKFALDERKINASLSNFMIYGPEITAKINKMSLKENYGIFVKNLSGKFTYTKKNILLKNMDLTTRHSHIIGDAGIFYKISDFSDFNNKVRWDVNVVESTISSTDIRHFYNELGKNRIFKLKSHITGTLNNLSFHNLHMKSLTKNSEIIGNVNFKYFFGKGNQYFSMQGKFDKVNSNYDNLVGLLPNVLGKTLPSSLKKIGQFEIKGTAFVTMRSVDADFFMKTGIGNVKSKLVMTNLNTIDNASYSGKILFDNFNLGYFLDEKDLGRVSFDFDVNGKGFTKKYLDTRLKGKIFKLDYNKYSYRGIVVDGNCKWPFFKGKLNVNDPNLFMDFDGMVDFSQKGNNKYDFLAQIDYANLKKMNFTKDSVSVFKGYIRMKIAGNTLDNLNGSVNITEAAYQNSKDNYVFDDIYLESVFDENKVRTVTVHSPDIIDGKIVGRFKFSELQKMLENAAGSLYANYKPNKLQSGQFLDFDIRIYNKIIEVFYPEIEVGTNTVMTGKIDSDQNKFSMDFHSPNIKYFDNHFDNIKLEIDNKNKMYNTYVEMDSIRTKFYKVSKFNLINIIQKDTLYSKTSFNGGKGGNDVYHLNLYHTIDKDKNNVVGIKKSDFTFKNYNWKLNDSLGGNKIVFDRDFKKLVFDNILLKHENEQIALNGNIKKNNYKDLQLDFENVNISKILPSVDSLRVKGYLNGKVNFKQDNKIFQPTASLTIDELNLNDIDLGDLSLDIAGDESLKNFTVDSALNNKDVESFTASGGFSVSGAEPTIDLDFRFNKFNLASLSPLGADVITNIRGYVSGAANMVGPLKKPDINGRLYLEKAGMKIPYLNLDYALEDNSYVDLSGNQFIFQNEQIYDTAFNTKGTLNGVIKHKMFSDWNLDLTVNSDRLLALDTKYTEESAYYGRAFIQGNASIVGPVSDLMINVTAKSQKGTEIKIPISNSDSVENNSFIKFISPLEKYYIEQGIVNKKNNFGGLEMKFDLDLTQDAEIEVILDRESGHGMKGNGNGNILLEINTQGKFNMYGDYQIYQGYYNFKYKGLIDKRFEVKKYSSISWEGDPMRARLDMEAIYKVPGGSNPAIILENTNVNRNIPTDISIKITGNLASPEPDFDINFPTASSILKSELQTKLGDKNIRQTQALSLLATGSYVSNEGISQDAMKANVYQSVGSLFDNVFKNQDEKLKVGVNLVPTTRSASGIETSGQVGVTVSSQVNERISVNGQVGVPTGGINQSSVVGNVMVQYRVNEDGSLNLRFFNRENDVNYVGQGIGYTQGLGVTYEADFNSFNELMQKIFKNKQKQKAKTNIYEIPDSNDNPDGINFSQPLKKKKKHNHSTEQPNRGAIPPSKED